MLNRPGSRLGHKAVLAMTFTNKATEEMKSRIIHELAVLAGCEKDWDEPSPYEKTCVPPLAATLRGSLLRPKMRCSDYCMTSAVSASRLSTLFSRRCSARLPMRRRCRATMPSNLMMRR